MISEIYFVQGLMEMMKVRVCGLQVESGPEFRVIAVTAKSVGRRAEVGSHSWG